MKFIKLITIVICCVLMVQKYGMTRVYEVIIPEFPSTVNQQDEVETYNTMTDAAYQQGRYYDVFAYFADSSYVSQISGNVDELLMKDVKKIKNRTSQLGENKDVFYSEYLNPIFAEQQRMRVLAPTMRHDAYDVHSANHQHNPVLMYYVNQNDKQDATQK